jgi:hypothetical protein
MTIFDPLALLGWGSSVRLVHLLPPRSFSWNNRFTAHPPARVEARGEADISGHELSWEDHTRALMSDGPV